jgi:O-acetyl-ADP-ribose deacetylase (regulator of RNase III)
MTSSDNVRSSSVTTPLATFKRCRGDLLESQAQALVNPVNCLGVCGAGLAEDFKIAHPGNYLRYRKACKDKELKIGTILAVQIQDDPVRYVVNFPTKVDWRNASRLPYIVEGLKALAAWIARERISSIAIPKIGCGLGGLDWPVVETLILSLLSHVDCEIELYV